VRAWRLAAGLCAVLAVAACGGNGPLLGRPEPRGIVKVALVDAFSGAQSSSGQYLRNSLQVAVDELNAGGGVLGYRVEVVTADDQLQPAKAAELVREQVSDKDVKLLVGPSSTDLYRAARASIDAAQTPNCLAADVTDDALSGEPTTFRTQGRDQDRVGALMGYLARQAPNAKKVGLVASDDARGHALDNLLANVPKPGGLTYAGAAFAAADATDQTPALEQMLGAGVQALLISGDEGMTGQVAQAVDQLGQTGKLQLLGLDGAGDYAYPSTGGPAAVGTVFASTIQTYLTGTPQSRWPPAYRDFENRITSQYGFAPNGVEMQGEPAAADCVKQWSMAVGRARTFVGEQVAKAWEGLDIPASQSVLGVREALTLLGHDSVPAAGIFVYQWKQQGGRFQLTQLQP
jgi:branched-chain amino acid transport system substrate-binding protein